MTALGTFSGIHPVHHFQGALFALQTNSDTVHMYEEDPGSGGEAWAVVLVDPERFLQLWRRPGSSHPEVAHQSPAMWSMDRKFRGPDKHFAEGRANPVLLAIVSCELRHFDAWVWRRWLLRKVLVRVDVTEHPVLSFTDGVTRTIWLLTHSVKAIPVKCAMADAALLQALAGVDGSQPVAVGTLFKKKWIETVCSISGRELMVTLAPAADATRIYASTWKSTMTPNYTQAELPFTLADYDAAEVDALLLPGFDGGYGAIWEALRAAARGAREAKQPRTAAVLQILGDACSMRLLPEDITTPFKPFAIIGDQRSAILEGFDSAAVGFFTEVASHANHPALRARVADIAWLRTPRSGVALAITAINAYRALPLATNTWHHGADKCWLRALQLATTLGAAGMSLADDIETALLAEFDGADPAVGRAQLFYSEPLFARLPSPARRGAIAETLERSGRIRSDNGRHREARDFWTDASRWYGKAARKDDAYRITVEIAEAWANEALAQETMQQSSAAAAASAYENAIQLYRSVPVKVRTLYDGDARMVKLRLQLQAAGERAVGDMQTISTPPMNITEIVKMARADVTGKSPLDALGALADLFPGPVEVEVRRDTEMVLKQSFARQVMGTRHITRDGRVAAIAPAYSGSVEDREARLLVEMVQDFQITMSLVVGGQVLPAMREIALEHQLDQGVFIALARESPMVPVGREILYGRGLYAGYCGDYDVAVHLLVPQVEHLVRYHLKAAGAVTTTLSKEGIDNENGLSWLIKLPEMRKVFGSDLTFELSAVFTDGMGPNLRNELAHGLLDDGEAYSVAGIYAWWVCFRLAFKTFWNVRNPGVNAEPVAVPDLQRDPDNLQAAGSGAE